MNELRALDPLSISSFEDAFRGFLRPWQVESPVTAPSIRVDVSETDNS